MLNRRIAWLFIAITLLFTFSNPALAQENEVPRFEPITCDEFSIAENAVGAVYGEDVECGYLIVPEFHDQPDGETIKLGMVIIKSTNDNPAPDPLVMTQGGPGGSGIELYSFLAAPDNEIGLSLRADRDLIIFEQRGTLYSKPFLFCDEVYDLDIESMEREMSDEEGDRLYVEAYAACRERLTDEGVNLSAYNSEENAHDLADLAAALGYDQINYYGVSYGTMLGQHLMRLHPDLLRSVVLDGVVAISISPNQEMGVANNRSFTQLFDACAADDNCNQYYPDLEQVFFDTVDSLDQKPVRVPITDPETGVTYDAIFGGGEFESFVIQLFYQTDAIPLLPKFIYDVRDGRYDLYSTLQSLLAFDKNSAEGMYFSVMCAEDFDYTPEEVNTSGVRPQFAEDQRADAALTQDICELWDVTRLGVEADQAISTDLPTLLFSGNFDPVTPPNYADTVADSLSNDYAYVFPANGHGAFLTSDCANRILRDFVNDPSQEPDADACMAALTPPTFITPGNTLMAPAIMNLLGLVNYLFTDPSFGTEEARTALTDLAKAYSMPSLAGFWLFSFPGIWFIGWILVLLLKKPKERCWPARLAPWLVVLMVGIIAVFVGALASRLITGGVFDLYAGLSRDHPWVFALPWVIAGITGALVAIAIASWVKGYWGPVRRVYFSLTALAALAYSLSLAATGMLAVLLG